jgi:hypothetical protein
MWMFGVIKFDPVADHPFGDKAIRHLMQIDRFIFEAAPQPLDEDVVQAAPATAQGDLDICIAQDIRKGSRGKLCILIGVEDLRLTVFVQRLSFKASTQNLASSVFDSRHDRTLRIAQSITATK